MFPGVMTHAHAQVIPPSADANRISPEPRQVPKRRDAPVTISKDMMPPSNAPEGVEQIHLVINSVKFDNVHAFTPAELKPLYSQYLGKDVTLDVLYRIADKLTQMYRSKGYFLSMGYVPDQKIGNGVVHIAAIEGHIDHVELQGKNSQNYILTDYIKKITSETPVKSDSVESFLLRINDLPGFDYRAVLAPMPEGSPGAVKLVLVAAKEKGRGLISFDNFSSRYLGPNELSLFYSKSIIPLQTTTISALASIPTDELKYITLEQSAVILPNLKLKVGVNATKSAPGYTLKVLEVESTSNDFYGELEWQPLRQREKNFTLSLKLERRNTATDILDTKFSRDHIRVARLKANMDGSDSIGGYNIGEVMVSHGLSGWGASKDGDPDVSRPEASPDFTKFEAKYTHLQQLPKDLVLTIATAGQWASRPMYSSEEFGYGGQSFGRAFDASEITGDSGISGSAELQYNGFDLGSQLSANPYVFYDIGQIWNMDAGQDKKASGASAGFGLRGQVLNATSYNVGFAYPLTRSISTPVYGSGTTGPRIYVQLNQNF